jgi:hypothetical protein
MPSSFGIEPAPGGVVVSELIIDNRPKVDQCYLFCRLRKFNGRAGYYKSCLKKQLSSNKTAPRDRQSTTFGHGQEPLPAQSVRETDHAACRKTVAWSRLTQRTYWPYFQRRRAP